MNLTRKPLPLSVDTWTNPATGDVAPRIDGLASSVSLCLTLEEARLLRDDLNDMIAYLEEDQ